MQQCFFFLYKAAWKVSFEVEFGQRKIVRFPVKCSCRVAEGQTCTSEHSVYKTEFLFWILE